MGRTGTGFDKCGLKELHAAMTPLVRGTSPLAGSVEAHAPATWVRPELVANIKFTEWIREGHMRHPVFLGLRKDKEAKSVVREENTAVGPKAPGKVNASRASAKPAKAKAAKAVIPAPSVDAANKQVKIGKATVALTNLNKVFWPGEGLTKGDVVAYYERIAPLILPYLKDRPQSLFRTPNGIKAPGFFQKDAGEEAPPWVKTFEVASDSRGGENDQLPVVHQQGHAALHG